MPPETKTNTFGSYLKASRQHRGLTIDDLAQRTKIAVHCLKAMEDDAEDRLPPRAYVRSFIRAYARSTGADTDVALELYAGELARQATSKKRWLRRQAKLGMARHVLVATVVILVVLMLVRHTNFFLDLSPPAPLAAPEPVAINTDPVAVDDSADRGPADETVGEALRLEIVAVEHTRLKILVDGQYARSYDLKPEDRLELEGSKNFNLMIGNATGLKILLDGKPVKIFGSSGQVVSLKIP